MQPPQIWQIREYGKNTNLITGRLTGQEWNDALVLMKTHQMIELPGHGANLEDLPPVYIYSTVNVFCSAMDINELVRTYQDEVEELLTEEEKERRVVSDKGAVHLSQAKKIFTRMCLNNWGWN